MESSKLTQSDIARGLGESPYWVKNRLQGKAKLGVIEAIKIQVMFFPDVPLAYLFSPNEGQTLRF